MTKHSEPPEPARPLTPSNDTVRIATALGSAYGEASDSATRRQPLPAATVEAAIRERARRSAYVPGQVLTDPAWDMLLELLHAELEQRRVAASILCKAAGVSRSAGLRWIDVLVSKGLCTRTQDDDPNKVLVELSEKGSQAMRGYFEQAPFE